MGASLAMNSDVNHIKGSELVSGLVLSTTTPKPCYIAVPGEKLKPWVILHVGQLDTSVYRYLSRWNNGS